MSEWVNYILKNGLNSKTAKIIGNFSSKEEASAIAINKLNEQLISANRYPTVYAKSIGDAIVPVKNFKDRVLLVKLDEEFYYYIEEAL